LVAGGTGGLGRAVTLAFLRAEAKVHVTYRKQAELDELRRSAETSAAQLQAHSVDVTDENSVRQLVESILNKDGRLDVLVNTVGTYAGGVPLWRMESDLFERMIALNLRSGYTLAQAMVPQMLRQGHGSIINVAAKAAFSSQLKEPLNLLRRWGGISRFNTPVRTLRHLARRAFLSVRLSTGRVWK
jgi:NAD(P)-dependent dehydrogenase (short-subunit alcohol dehydrogenase family)